MVFMGNNAVVGSAIYVNELDFCAWSSYYPPYFHNTSNVFQWPFISYKYVHYGVKTSKVYSYII